MTTRFDRFKNEIGVKLGPLTSALFDAAHRIEAHCDDPVGTVYESLPQRGCRIFIDFPEPIQYATPTNVVLFGSTGLSCHAFGFVKANCPSPTTTTDDLVVCLHYPEALENMLFVNLAAFLSLAAVAGTEAIEAAMTDEDYQRAHLEALKDDDFCRASALLCELEGVSLPLSPSAVVRDSPKVELPVEKAPPSVVSIEEAHRLLKKGNRAAASEVVALLVGKFVALGDLVPLPNWQALGELVRATQPPLSTSHQAALHERGVERGCV